jgi:hypothetical protein
MAARMQYVLAAVDMLAIATFIPESIKTGVFRSELA